MLPQSLTPVLLVLKPIRQKKHIIFGGKRRTIRVEVVTDEEYNQLDEMVNFIDREKYKTYGAFINYSPLKTK